MMMCAGCYYLLIQAPACRVSPPYPLVSGDTKFTFIAVGEMTASDVDLMNGTDTIIIASNEHQGKLTSIVKMNYFITSTIDSWKFIPTPRTLPNSDLTTESTDASFTCVDTVDVNDKSFKVNHIVTHDGRVFMFHMGRVTFDIPSVLAIVDNLPSRSSVSTSAEIFVI